MDHFRFTSGRLHAEGIATDTLADALRRLPRPGVHLPEVQRGDHRAIFTTGGYGMTMARTDNDQPLHAEVLIDGHRGVLPRPRQSAMDLLVLALTERPLPG